MKEHGAPFLSIHALSNAPDDSSFPVMSMEHSVNRFVGSDGKITEHPTPAQENCAALNYLCAVTPGKQLNSATQFLWNWLDESQLAGADGIISISRSALAEQIKKKLLPAARNCCFKTAVTAKCNPLGPFHTSHSLTPGQTPEVYMPQSGGRILSLVWGENKVSNDDKHDKEGATYIEFDIHTKYTCDVDVNNDDNRATIVIKQQMYIWVYVQWDNSLTRDRVVDRVITDTIGTEMYDRSFGTFSTSYAENRDKNLSFDSFTKKILDEDVISNITSYARNIASANFRPIPLDFFRNIIFPGGKVFDIIKIFFSDNGDLVCTFKYVDLPPGS
jgi:hypothetical protein